jgi:hypothetical protein
MTKKRRKSKYTGIQKVVFLLVAVIVLSVATTFALLYFFDTSPDEIKTLKYTYTAKENVGFVLDTDALHFGGGPRGALMVRNINMSTTEDARVKITSVGPGTVTVSENDFFLPANTSKELTFSLSVPLDAQPGFYEGIVYFSFYR